MSSELAIPEDASKILRDKLRSMFLELMPDEKLDEVLKAEWDKFFKDETEKTTSWGFGSVWNSGTSYNRKVLNDDMWGISPFKYMVRKLMVEMFRDKLTERLKDELQKMQWDDGRYSQTLTARVVAECAPALLKEVTHAFIESTAQSIRNAIENPR